MPARAALQALILAVAVLGAVPAGAADACARWLRVRGGELSGPDRERVVHVAAALRARADAPPLRVHVVAGREPAAFAWPDGAAVVTTALLDLLDDDELAAALAHEAGHLLAGPAGPAGLADAAGAVDAEAAADRAAVGMLAAGGWDPSVVGRMLRKVADAPTLDAAARARLGRRVALLDAAPR